MSNLKHSLAWWCFNRPGIEPKSFMRTAKQIGYEAIELVPRELWDTVREAGLAIATDNGGLSLTEGLNRRENHNQLEDQINRALEQAVAYEIPNVIVFSGNRRGLSDVEGAMNTAEGLRRVAPAAEQKGVSLVLELLNSKVDHPDYQCDHTAWGVSVVKMVNSPRVKLLYDIYHMQVMEGDIIRTLRAEMESIGHIHTAGNPGRHDMDDTQELYYPAILRAIAQTDYSGYIGHEFVPKGDPIEAIRATYQMCTIV